MRRLLIDDGVGLSYLQDGGHDVISQRNVLPFGQCIRSLRPAPAADYAAVYAAASAGCPLAILSTVPDP